jgi:predicted AlkP superfamily phosphohydrolase/phosphomutase
VLVLGIDGVGGYHLEEMLENEPERIPNYKRLVESGVSTMRARAQTLSVSAPNWAAMMTGMGPEETGIWY